MLLYYIIGEQFEGGYKKDKQKRLHYVTRIFVVH